MQTAPNWNEKLEKVRERRKNKVDDSDDIIVVAMCEGDDTKKWERSLVQDIDKNTNK